MEFYGVVRSDIGYTVLAKNKMLNGWKTPEVALKAARHYHNSIDNCSRYFVISSNGFREFVFEEDNGRLHNVEVFKW